MSDLSFYFWSLSFASFCVGGLVAWCYAFGAFWKLKNQFAPGRRWGQFLPVSLFLPWFFTPEGNAIRVKLLRYCGLFILLWLGAAASAYLRGDFVLS
jgi:hypothetical protein